MAKNTYIVEGGVGKCVSFTSIIPKLVEKDGGPIKVVSPHYQVFANNPDVEMVFDQASIFLDDPRIVESDNIIYCEPYKSNFVKGDEHILQSYCKLLGVEFDVSMKPKLYTDRVKPDALEWLESVGVKGKFMLVQFSGGQATMSYAPGVEYNSNNPGKNYPPFFAQMIINTLKDQFPDMAIIDATLPNEPGYVGTIKCDQHWTLIVELLKMSEGFISMDSSLQHFAAAVNVPGVVVWGNTRWTQYGWMHHKNMSYFDKNKYNTYYKMEPNDPRNIMVDPNDVYSTFVNLTKGKKVTDKEVRIPIK